VNSRPNNHGILCVVLACPPTTNGVRTLRMVGRVAEVMGYNEIRHVNLFSWASRDLRDLGRQGADAAGWLEARAPLARTLTQTDALLCAWGVVEPSGIARQHHRDQLNWFLTAARDLGFKTAMTIGGAPRHPSRWHQYVSDRHGRAGSGTTVDRLNRVLVSLPILSLAHVG
jgi:hypothetical protein